MEVKKVIKKQSLVDQVYETLRSDIIELKYPLGCRLKLSNIQERVGVSATPIREALNRLQQEGLVQFETNVGVRILALDAHDITEIEQLAVTLHSAAIRFAMEHTDHKVLVKELKARLKEYKAAKTPYDQVYAINHFVGVFYQNCGNDRLDKNMISIQGQQLLLRFIYAIYGDGVKTNIEDFSEIIEGVSEGNLEKACSALDRNTHRADPVLLDYISRS